MQGSHIWLFLYLNKLVMKKILINFFSRVVEVGGDFFLNFSWTQSERELEKYYTISILLTPTIYWFGGGGIGVSESLVTFNIRK